MVFISLLLVCAVIAYGAYANPFWKYHEKSEYYANGIFRALIGIAAWLTIILVLTGDYESAFGGVVLTVVFMALPLLRMKKDGILSVRYVFLLMMAALGVYARILLIWSLFGIPVANFMKRAAQIGYSNAIEEEIEYNRKHPVDTSGPSAMDILLASHDTTPEEVPSRPRITVHREREDGSLQELQVNTDGTMYKDPDTGEWKRIRR